jgi:ketosteroid isomerase-like protein
MVTEESVQVHFAPWETQDPMPFFARIPDNVKWQVVGHLNPLAGSYTSKNEVLTVFGKLTAKFSGPITAKITNLLVFGDSAVVEMSFAAETVMGHGFQQQMCWVCQYVEDVCVSLRLYVDTAAEKQLFEEV